MDITQVRGRMKWCALFLVLWVEINHFNIFYKRTVTTPTTKEYRGGQYTC